LEVPNSSTEQRRLAKRLVREMGGDALRLAEELRSGDWRERSLACFIYGWAGCSDPGPAFPPLREMASDPDWRVREAVATALTEISRRREADFLREVSAWISDPDPRVRRAAVESLRVLARREPEEVLPLLERVRFESDGYAVRAVGHILREMAKADPDLVRRVCLRWASEGASRPVRLALRKLPPEARREVESALEAGRG